MRSLWVVCELCHHEAVLNVDGYGDAVPVPAFGRAWSVRHAASLPHSHGRIGRSASHKGACRPAVGMSGPEGGPLSPRGHDDPGLTEKDSWGHRRG